MCDWKGKDIPSKERINQLELKKWTWENGKQELKRLAIFPAGKRDDPTTRMRIVAEGVHLILDLEEPYTLLTWKEFDDVLDEFYHYK
ncbi:hypothetical protein [Bacillus sp. FJAT-42315]|uniref:hypothetical protein n=1 Tax=Bacillus sp. FJAT-42315 TaxID=2014077 RepID=UPI000C23F25C|nr:hypothetical protein [Bacillus sp. FJAT-42315]